MFANTLKPIIIAEVETDRYIALLVNIETWISANQPIKSIFGYPLHLPSTCPEIHTNNKYIEKLGEKPNLNDST